MRLEEYTLNLARKNEQFERIKRNILEVRRHLDEPIANISNNYENHEPISLMLRVAEEYISRFVDPTSIVFDNNFFNINRLRRLLQIRKLPEDMYNHISNLSSTQFVFEESAEIKARLLNMEYPPRCFDNFGNPILIFPSEFIKIQSTKSKPVIYPEENLI